MKKSLLGLGIASAVTAGSLPWLVAAALAGGAIASLVTRPSPDAPFSRFWQEEAQPQLRIPEPWQMPPCEMPQPFGGPLSGALVTELDRGDPADEAGVEVGGIILALEGKAFDDGRDLATSIHEYRPGDEVVLTILRRDEETEIMELEMTLGRDRIEEGQVVAHLGVRYRPLSTGFCEPYLYRGARD